MKIILFLGFCLTTFSNFACEPFRVTHFYDNQLDAVNFVFMGTDLKGFIEGEILKKDTFIRGTGDIRGVTYSFLEENTTDEILTTIHKIIINSIVQTDKGQVYVSQNFLVRNSFSADCERLPKALDKIISGDQIMAIFTPEYVTNHPDYIKGTGELDYNLLKFSNHTKPEAALLKALEKKNLTLTRNNPKANFLLTIEQTRETPVSCTVKGILVSQKFIAGEKTSMEITPVTGLNCSQAVKKLVQNSLPQN